MLLVIACGGSGDGDRAAPGGEGGPLKVVASFYPLWEFSRAVGGERVEVTNLTAPGVEPHDLELTPRQVETLRAADLVVFIHGFQPALDDAIETLSLNDRAFDVSAGLALRPASPGSGGGGGASSNDPHVWLDPALAREVVAAIRDRLSQLDPAAKGRFEANAGAYNVRLQELDAAYRQGLEACDRRDFVTSHVAFGYLAARYGLEEVAIAGLSPDAEPSPQRLQEIVRLVEARGIKVIFFEELVDPTLAETIAAETGARTLVLNPLEGLTPEQQAAGKDYFAIARENLGHLREALGCR